MGRATRTSPLLRWLVKLLLKMTQKQKAMGKEEELLLQDFSRNVSTKSNALFYGNALIVSAVPIWLYWRIHLMDPLSSSPFFLVITILSTYLVSFAYKNTKFVLKHKVAIKREEAVNREISKKMAEDKKMNKKEKDERVLWKKNEVADYEATTFSIFYNNAMFLAVVITLIFFFKSFSPTMNYIFSLGLSSGLIALLSTGTK